MDRHDRMSARCIKAQLEHVEQHVWEQAQQRKHGGYLAGLAPGHGDERVT